MKILVKTLHGLEEVLAEELKQLGVEKMKMLTRAIQFEGDLKLLYRANLELRTAMRVLVPMYHFKARNEHQLYDGIRKIDWSKHMKVSDTLAIDGTVHSDFFNHSKYIALKTKDAIVDQFRDKTDKRPNVNVHSPTLRIQVHIQQDEVNVSFDSSGEPLFKRGYRLNRMDAPINEALAAGMIMLSGWKADSDFVDPMCGSGTIPIEAAFIAYNIPSQWFREQFGFERWKNFDARIWKEVRNEAKARERSFDHQVYGFDKDFKATRIAQHNAMAAEVDDKIIFKRSKFERLTPPGENGIMVINPPYDERLQELNINDLYAMMGDQFKQQFQGWEAWVISSNSRALKSIGLRPSKKIQLYNGPLECRFIKFEMYEGTRKKSKLENSEN